MQVGDLVRKKWGRIDPFQQNTAGIVIELNGSGWIKNYITVAYPNHSSPPRLYRRSEFEVISESR